MYISDLKIHGFKSFANKEDLNFGEGITAVVGPNGCGKTNIVDAIRWVLGEQKYSILRGTRMEDVIFNGAKGLKPLSVCEVFLTVHNNKGKLPIEYNDIEIGRRVYRNGESEYFLNRTPCRLKDIHDLFVDTGMGADAYSVIELKMIEQILSETAEDRKRMFEEAAGINKYKSQRRSALRKFEATKQDILRINDIIVEVETKVHGLNLQLKRFKRHAKLVEKLKESEIALAYLQISKYEELAKPFRAKILEFIHLRDSKTSEENIHETQLTNLRELYGSQEKELSTIQMDLDSYEEKREQIKQNVLIWTEQTRSADTTIERLRSEKDDNIRKSIQLSNQVKDYKEEILSLEPRIDRKHTNYKSGKEQFETIENQYKEAQSALEELQNRKWEEQRKMADQESLIKRTESLIKENTELNTRLERKLQVLESKQSDLSEEQKTLEKKKILFQSKLEEKKLILSKLKTSLSDQQSNHHQLTLEYHSTNSEIKSLESQLQFYQELVTTGEGFPNGVRYVLEHQEDFPDVLGTIADLFQVDETYQQALESGLGDLVHCLVTNNRKTAFAVLNVVRNQQAGSISLIPLKEISNLKTRQKKLPVSEFIIGRASDLISIDDAYRPLAEFLMGNLLIVNDLESAQEDSTLDRWNLVDLKGVFSGTNYVLKGSGKSNHVSVIGRLQKIEILQSEIEKMAKKAEELNKRLELLDKAIIDREKKIKILSPEVTMLMEKQSGIETEMIRNHYQQSQTLEGIQESTRELTETRKNLNQLTESYDALLSEKEVAGTKLGKLDENLEKANKSLTLARNTRDTFHQQLQDIRIDLLNLENQRENLQFQKTSAENTIVELNKNIKMTEDEIKSLEDKKVTLKKQITEGEAGLIKVKGKIRHQRSVLELKRQAYSHTYKEIEEIQNRIRTEQRNREAILEEIKQSELEVAEYERKILSAKERIRDRYNQAVPEILNVGKDEDAIEMDIHRMERSIESIGPVNMAVQAEYDEEINRLNLLNEQRDDLITAEQNLRETIQKIDRVARKQFLKTFFQIKTNFEKLFVLFFEGGQASLSLTGDPDPLEADITIHAQPPGKRNQTLRMLSAGEKSLTAIALLFSIYQYKPSPYCILDEVDAPLDDVNIRKFTRVLKQFSQETQFIVVTHNKLTMEAANFLYGVTMEKKGVSKLVSVKFED